MCSTGKDRPDFNLLKNVYLYIGSNVIRTREDTREKPADDFQEVGNSTNMFEEKRKTIG